jgi:hypothetical protein
VHQGTHERPRLWFLSLVLYLALTLSLGLNRSLSLDCRFLLGHRLLNQGPEALRVMRLCWWWHLTQLVLLHGHTRMVVVVMVVSMSHLCIERLL